MKNINKIFFTLLLICYLSSYGQTQSEINEDSRVEYRKLKSEMDKTYQDILLVYKDDLKFVKNFKKAQNIWILHRDADLELRFPKKDKKLEYGSIYSDCISKALIELTKERIVKLKVWLQGVDEGNVCSGSVKIN